jgi:DNA-binding GntR family transcriptional regulator
MQVPDDSDPRPLYVQIADDLRARITSGELPPPSRLPTLKDLASCYGVAVETVRNAIAVLATEGVVGGGSTRGNFVLKMPGEPEPAHGPALAELRKRVEEVSEQARSGDTGPLLERIGTIEANLMDLYGKLGYEYPGKAPGRRERKAAGS